MHPPYVHGRRQWWKWWWSDLKAARFSLWLAAALTVVQVILSSIGVRPVDPPDPVYVTFGLSRPGMAAWLLWQPVSHALVHGGWAHLLVNVLLLVFTGARVERIADARTAARVFCAGVLAGGVAFLLMPTGGSLLVGASGGVFALLLWLATVSPESRMAPLRISARSLGLGIIIASGALMVVSFWWIPGGVPVAHACHFGGALAGWWLARRSMRLPPLPPRRD